jgi:hypothetical protein
MTRLFKLQFLGPLVLFVATLSAEIAARALTYAPSSKVLWFINLRMFGIFQRSDAVLSYVTPNYVTIHGFQLFGVALPIFSLACFGLVARSRFPLIFARVPLIFATHLSVAYAAFLVLSWRVGVPAWTQASLGPIAAVPTGAGLYVLATIVGACLLSSVLSHVVYLLAVREELHRWRRGPSSAKTG